MTRTHGRRKLLVHAPLAAVALILPGCMLPPPEPQTPPEPEPPLPMLGSIAAFATVQEADAASRQVILRTAGGGLLNVTAGPEFRGMASLRPGTRLVAEYDARGELRLGFPPRPNQLGRSGRILGMIQEIERGGRRLTIVDRQGHSEAVGIPDRAMMAFATRLRPGDEVAVTVSGQ